MSLYCGGLMEKNVLLEMLTEASSKKAKGNVFEFSEQDKASFLVAADGSIMVIEDVSRIDLKEGYVIVRAGKDDVLLLALERIMGLKLQRSKREGAGFLA